MDEEDANATMAGATKKLAAEGEELKKDIEDLERSLAKAEQEKNTKETQIKSLQDEMAQQDELIAKLTREKKKVEENNRVSFVFHNLFSLLFLVFFSGLPPIFRVVFFSNAFFFNFGPQIVVFRAPLIR